MVVRCRPWRTSRAVPSANGTGGPPDAASLNAVKVLPALTHIWIDKSRVRSTRRFFVRPTVQSGWKSDMRSGIGRHTMPEASHADVSTASASRACRPSSCRRPVASHADVSTASASLEVESHDPAGAGRRSLTYAGWTGRRGRAARPGRSVGTGPSIQAAQIWGSGPAPGSGRLVRAVCG